MVYDDIVQIVAGYQGSGLQPWVQFQRRALHLLPNTTYTNLTALLTVSHSGHDTQRFPYLEGLRSNSTDRFELTPVAAISVHLLGSDGEELHVNQPISVSVPLPANSGLKENEQIPAWRFDPKLGAWLKSSLGLVQRDGAALTLTYLAPQLGYWVAAMSPVNTGPVVAKDISSYHTVFLLAILGGMAIILLFLLCVLLYYCRRKCARSRRGHQKFTLSSSLDVSKRDQATSMSHLNLISEIQLDHVGVEPDLHTPMLKPGPYDSSTNQLVTSRDELRSRVSNGERHRRSAETFAMRSARSAGPSEGFDSPAPCGDYRRSYSSVISTSPHPLHTSVPSSTPHPLHHAASAGRLSADSKAGECQLRLSSTLATPITPATSPTRDREALVERRPADHLLSRSVDHLERPAAFPRPGALLCCTSELQVSQGEATYQKARPTLLIPAHYIRLPGTHPLSGQALLLQSDEQSELECIRAELNASHQPQGEAGQGDGEGGPEEGREGEGGRPAGEWTLQTAALPEGLSIPNSLSQAGLGVVQMNGEDQILAEKTLMELRGGKPLPHPRAWFVSLDGRSNAHIRHSYIDLQRAGHSASGAGSNDASLDSGVDMSDVTPGRRGRDPGKGQERTQPPVPPAAFTQLVFVEGAEAGGNTNENTSVNGAGNANADAKAGETPHTNAEAQAGESTNANANAKAGESTIADAKAGGYANANANDGVSESPSSASSPEDGSLGCLVTNTVSEEMETLTSPSSPLLPSPPLPEPIAEGVRGEEGAEDLPLRTERTQTSLLLPHSDGGPGDPAPPDDGGEDDNKKSPWQKREERPLLALNLK
ncbi:protein FAM171A1 isoform X2 [Brachyhypopomus gauderio]